MLELCLVGIVMGRVWLCLLLPPHSYTPKPPPHLRGWGHGIPGCQRQVKGGRLNGQLFSEEAWPPIKTLITTSTSLPEGPFLGDTKRPSIPILEAG